MKDWICVFIIVYACTINLSLAQKPDTLFTHKEVFHDTEQNIICENYQDCCASFTQTRCYDELNHQIIEQYNTVFGRRNGEYIEYYSNGRIKTFGNYCLGHKVGHWRSYYSSGALFSVINYSVEEDSVLKSLSGGILKPINDSLLVYCCPEVQDNESYFFYENGNIMAKEVYRNGIPVGWWKYYDINGNLIRKENCGY